MEWNGYPVETSALFMHKQQHHSNVPNICMLCLYLPLLFSTCVLGNIVLIFSTFLFSSLIPFSSLSLSHRPSVSYPASPCQSTSCFFSSIRSTSDGFVNRGLGGGLGHFLSLILLVLAFVWTSYHFLISSSPYYCFHSQICTANRSVGLCTQTHSLTQTLPHAL